MFPEEALLRALSRPEQRPRVKNVKAAHSSSATREKCGRKKL